MEEDLDEIPAAVQTTVNQTLVLARRVRADDCLHPALVHRPDNVFGVVGSVADKSATLGVFDQLVGDRRLVLLPRRDRDVEWATFAVDEGVKLG